MVSSRLQKQYPCTLLLCLIHLWRQGRRRPTHTLAGHVLFSFPSVILQPFSSLSPSPSRQKYVVLLDQSVRKDGPTRKYISSSPQPYSRSSSSTILVLNFCFVFTPTSSCRSRTFCFSQTFELLDKFFLFIFRYNGIQAQRRPSGPFSFAFADQPRWCQRRNGHSILGLLQTICFMG